MSSGAVHNSAPKEGSLNRGMRQDSIGRGRGRGQGRGVGMYLVMFVTKWVFSAMQ